MWDVEMVGWGTAEADVPIPSMRGMSYHKLKMSSSTENS
jgi:hypothetical protein